MNSSIFVGDLNKMKSGLTVTENVYHIKNIGDLVTKIKVTKKNIRPSNVNLPKASFFCKTPKSKTNKSF